MEFKDQVMKILVSLNNAKVQECVKENFNKEMDEEIDKIYNKEIYQFTNSNKNVKFYILTKIFNLIRVDNINSNRNQFVYIPTDELYKLPMDFDIRTQIKVLMEELPFISAEICLSCQTDGGIEEEITGYIFRVNNEKLQDMIKEYEEYQNHIAEINRNIKDVTVSIIDCFEDLLDENDITIPDDDRTGEETEARIFGTTYGDLESKIHDIIFIYTSELIANIKPKYIKH